MKGKRRGGGGMELRENIYNFGERNDMDRKWDSRKMCGETRQRR